MPKKQKIEDVLCRTDCIDVIQRDIEYIRKWIDTEYKEKHDLVLTQCIKTNSRVTELEKWKAYITGGLAIIIILFIPILLNVVTNWINSK